MSPCCIIMCHHYSVSIKVSLFLYNEFYHLLLNIKQLQAATASSTRVEHHSRLLFLLHTFILPEGNLLPADYRTAVSCVNSYLLPADDYHCCVNDCVVYRNSVSGQHKDLTVCPSCGEDRYLSGTQTPRKRFKYIPLPPRLRKMFRN